MQDGDRGSRLTASLLARPGRVLVVAALMALTATALASRLQLKTAFTELLPSDDPAVVALKRTAGRVGDLNLLTVGIRSPDRAANLRYAKALADDLRQLPPTQVGLVATDLHDLQAFFREHKWLYASLDDLESIRDRLHTEIVKRKNPLFVDLDPGDEGAPSDEELRQRLGHAPLEDRFPDGYFVRGDVAWVLVLPSGSVLDERAGESLLGAVERFVAAHPPSAYHPAMRVQSLGPVVVGLENRRAIEQDIVGVTVVCTLLVALSIGLYFRGVSIVPLIVVAAGAGTSLAFATGELAFGYLNSSTAFLGSIILGNGINHPIVLLSRFGEIARERPPRTPEDTRAAMAEAIAGTARATFTAALAASVSYLSLLMTSFRGFSQFGVMAAVGSVACWASAYTVVPAVVVWRARRSTHVVAPAPLSLRRLGDFVARRAPVVVAVSAVLTVAALYGLRHFAASPFEYDFRHLRADVARTEERHQLDDNLNDMLGRWHSPMVVLADRIGQVEDIRHAIAAGDSRTRPVIGQVVTIYDILPGTPELQKQKLATLDEIRKLTRDPALATLNQKDRDEIERLRPPEDLRPLGPQDLPPIARRPFTERDGTVGRIVLVYHAAKNVTMWDGHDLMSIAKVIERLTLSDGSVIETSGTPMVFGAMLRSVLHDGPRATALSFLAVALLVSLLLPRARVKIAAIATFTVGVLWMVGAAGLFHVRVTFLNFIALPITFGVGGEYAMNVASRWHLEGSVRRTVASVGGAVLLCSWTTIVGYGSLLAAHSQALRGFGAMAILGEIACLVAALVVMPAFVAWRTHSES
ncbi:MAG TPA: MMPL family transporter [Polyangia bacterium]|nr:MMPL family transporter [Polyangia bacterium]